MDEGEKLDLVRKQDSVVAVLELNEKGGRLVLDFIDETQMRVGFLTNTKGGPGVSSQVAFFGQLARNGNEKFCEIKYDGMDAVDPLSVSEGAPATLEMTQAGLEDFVRAYLKARLGVMTSANRAIFTNVSAEHYDVPGTLVSYCKELGLEVDEELLNSVVTKVSGEVLQESLSE